MESTCLQQLLPEELSIVTENTKKNVLAQKEVIKITGNTAFSGRPANIISVP